MIGNTAFPADLLIIDTETTGLLENRHAKIIQIAAVLLDRKDLYQKDSYTTNVVIPKADWTYASPGALKCHGMKWKDIEGSPSWETAFHWFQEHFSQYTYDIYGQNIMGFDIPMMKRMCKCHNIPYPYGRGRNGVLEVDLWPFFLTTGVFLDLPYAKGYASLDNMAKYFGIEKGTKHQALEDCEITAEVLRRVRKLIHNGVL